MVLIAHSLGGDLSVVLIISVSWGTELSVVLIISRGQ